MAVSPHNLEEEAHGFNKWQLGLYYRIFQYINVHLWVTIGSWIASQMRMVCR
jgi:hypothetical protein